MASICHAAGVHGCEPVLPPVLPLPVPPPEPPAPPPPEPPAAPPPVEPLAPPPPAPASFNAGFAPQPIATAITTPMAIRLSMNNKLSAGPSATESHMAYGVRW